MEVLDDGNGRIKYQGNWDVSNATGAGGGTVHSSTDPAGVISLTFVGSSIEIDAEKSPNGANFTVVLDGSTYGPYSLYSPTASVGNVWSQSQLNPTATHTIFLQKAKESAGPDSVLELNLDAFRIPAAVITSSSSSPTSITAASTTSRPVSSTSTSSLPQTSTSTSLSSSLSSVSTPPPTSSIPQRTSTLSPPTSAPDGGPDDVSLPDSSPSPSSSDSPLSSSDPSPNDETPSISPITYTDDEFTDPSNLQPASSQTSKRSSTSSSTKSSSRSSTSSTAWHPSTTLSLRPFSMPSASPSASAAASTDPSSIGEPDNRTGIILGSIVGVIIFLCLLTIPIVYLKRRRAARDANDLKASTTPAYQTRTTKGLLMPLGVYRRSASAFTNTLNHARPWSPRNARSPISPTSPIINHHFGFGSQRGANTNTESSHTGHGLSPSPLSPARGAMGERPTSYDDRDARSHFVLYPDAAPGMAGVGASNGPDFPRHRHGQTDSISSDYPYPLTYQPATAL